VGGVGRVGLQELDSGGAERLVVEAPAEGHRGAHQPGAADTATPKFLRRYVPDVEQRERHRGLDRRGRRMPGVRRDDQEIRTGPLEPPCGVDHGCDDSFVVAGTGVSHEGNEIDRVDDGGQAATGGKPHIGCAMHLAVVDAVRLDGHANDAGDSDLFGHEVLPLPRVA